MGVHPHAPMKGVQSPCPLCVRVPRGVRPGPDLGPSRPGCGEGRASALRGRLQSVDPTKLNARSSEVALAPRVAGRAEESLRAFLLVARDEDWTRKKLRALRQRTPHLRLGASLLLRDTTLLPV